MTRGGNRGLPLLTPRPYCDNKIVNKNKKNNIKLEVYSVERIYLRQRCSDASKPRVAASTSAQYQYVGFSRRNKIMRCSAYAMGESTTVTASGV